MFRNRKEMGRPFSPSKNCKALLSRSITGKSPRRCLSTSISSSTRMVRLGGKQPCRIGGASANMKVVVRVRPLSLKETNANQRHIVKIVDDKMLIFDPKEEDSDFFFHGSRQKGRDMLKKQHKNCQFLFDRVFGPDSSNEDVFEGSTKSIVSSVLDGFNCSVFVYGATGAGKTHTMLGSEQNPGITFRTMGELFRQVQAQDCKKFDIRASYLEVYNEDVHDLLNPGAVLHLREDGSGVMVAGLKMEQISSPDKMFELLEQGNKSRTQHPTDSNAESSRSHAVFQVFIKMTTKATGQAKLVKLSLIDLAGSERGAATGCAGARFKEGSNINKSLLALGNCINALADGSSHIPYRNSKLTRILKDSLGGNCQTVMIANVSPAHVTMEDTHNTLKYAQRAKAIKVQITRNEVSVKLHVSNYIKMNEDLTKENTQLKEEMYKLKEEIAKYSEYPNHSKIIEQLQEELHKLKEELVLTKKEAQLCEEAFKLNCPPGLISLNSLQSDPAIPKPTSITVAANTSNLQNNVNHKALDDILERAANLFKEKALLQKRYLNLDSSEKVLHVQMYLKERCFDRVQGLSSTPCRKEAARMKVDRALGQYTGRLASANECQETLALEKNRLDESLADLKAEAEELNILDEFNSRLETLQCKFTNKELIVQCEHLEKMVLILSQDIEHQNKFIDEISEVFRSYHNLLKGHGHMTDQMLAEYNTLMRHSEAIKSVNWTSDSLSSCNKEFPFSQSAPLRAISKNSAKLSFDHQVSPASNISGNSDSSFSSMKCLESLKKDCDSEVPHVSTEKTLGCSHLQSEFLEKDVSSSVLQIGSQDLSQGSPNNGTSTTKSSCCGSSSLSHPPEKQSRITSPPPGSPELHQYSPVSGVGAHVDTATMLDSLGQLNSKVESLLNTSIPSSDDVGDRIVCPAVIDGTFYSLNSTFDASDKFSSTMKKDLDANSPKKSINLNVTFENSPKSQPASDSSDALNTTFSIDSPSQTPTSPAAQTLSTEPKTVLSAIASSTFPDTTAKLKKSSPLSVGPSTSLGMKTSRSSPVFAVPSIPPTKSRFVLSRPQPLENFSKSNKKVMLPQSSATLPSSSKQFSLHRKPIGAALKMKTTPSKVKAIWNKENRNAVLSSLTGTTKTGAVSKFSKSGSVKCEGTRKVLNDTFTKEPQK